MTKEEFLSLKEGDKIRGINKGGYFFSDKEYTVKRIDTRIGIIYYKNNEQTHGEKYWRFELTLNSIKFIRSLGEI